MFLVAMVGSVIIWVVSGFAIFILNVECWLQNCFKCISVMDDKKLSKTNTRSMASFFYFPFLVLLWGNYLENKKRWEIVLSAPTESLIYKLNNLLPNHFLQSHWYLLGTKTLPDEREKSCSYTAAFMFYLKALKIFPPQLCRKKGWDWWRAIMFQTQGL